MCIIVYAPSGVKIPDESTLNNCFENNKDGCGFMYAYNKKVVIRKGFMKFDDFMDNFNNTKHLFCDDKDITIVPVVLHFRIATSGGISPDKCHPFPITDNIDLLNHPHVLCKYGVAHNGIISKGKKDLSDTQEFIINVLSKLYSGNILMSDAVNYLLHMSSSKFIIMDKNCNLSIAGTFNKKNEIYYSNYSHEKYKYKTYDYTKDSWGGKSHNNNNAHNNSYTYNGYNTKNKSRVDCILNNITPQNIVNSLTSRDDEYPAMSKKIHGVCPICNKLLYTFDRDLNVSNKLIDVVKWTCYVCKISWISVYPFNHPLYKRYTVQYETGRMHKKDNSNVDNKNLYNEYDGYNDITGWDY